MSMKDYESELFGTVKIGIIDSIDPLTYRATVRFPDSLALTPNVIITPSASIGFLPEAETLVVVYDRPGWAKYIIAVLSQINDRTPEEIATGGENDPAHIPIGSMKPGDVFVGKYGRAYFNSAGDAKMNTFHERASLSLDDKEATAKISAYNFNISTVGEGISISSDNSIPGIFGDSISIKKSVPSPLTMLPSSLGSVIPFGTISEFKIDSLGDLSMEVGLSTPITPAAYLRLDVAGDAHLGNIVGSGLNIWADTDVELYNYRSKLKLGLSGISTLSTPTAEVYVDILGVSKISSRKSFADPVPSASIMLNGPLGINTMFGEASNVFNANVSNIFDAPVNSMTGIFNLNGPLNLVGLSGTVVSSNPLTMTTPGFSVISPSTSFSGNTAISGNASITGNASIVGNTSINGNTSITGTMTVLGLPAFSGFASALPFLPMVEIAFIPVTVMVGGVPVIGKIPVHA